MTDLVSSSMILKLLADPRLELPSLIEPERACQKFQDYLRLWAKWNAKINLTAETDPAQFLSRHIFVSLLYARALDPESRVLDIGSGAGLPGIPLKVCLPGLDLLLVESQRKRATFLSTVVRDLGLSGARVHHGRVEAMESEPRESFDAVVFRAVSDTAACLALAEPWLKPGGRAVLLKSQKNTATPLSHPYFTEPRALSVQNQQNEWVQLVVYTKSG